jgi:hypothetical protein
MFIGRRVEIIEAEKIGKGWKIGFKDDGWDLCRV